jgi:hypothetical protein
MRWLTLFGLGGVLLLGVVLSDSWLPHDWSTVSDADAASFWGGACNKYVYSTKCYDPDRADAETTCEAGADHYKPYSGTGDGDKTGYQDGFSNCEGTNCGRTVTSVKSCVES